MLVGIRGGVGWNRLGVGWIVLGVGRDMRGTSRFLRLMQLGGRFYHISKCLIYRKVIFYENNAKCDWYLII